jgi:RNA polymerase-binding transcription factor DksA
LLALRGRLVRAVNSSEQALREDILAPGDSSSVPTHPADADAEGVDEQVAIAQNEEFLLSEVVAALERIDGGTYGSCARCGGPIARERLNAAPYAALCIDCARREEQSRGPA